MSFIFPSGGATAQPGGGGGGGGGQELAWWIDRDTVADYDANDVVLTLTYVPVDPLAIIFNLNNGLLTYGVDWDLVGQNIIILFDKAPDGQDHYFTAQYPYNV